MTAVHSYEDCALWQFEEARRLGHACIYDVPTAFYRAWDGTQTELMARHRDWAAPGRLTSNHRDQLEQKRREMALADVVLVPSSYARSTIARFVEKRVMLAPYGVDSDFWRPLSGRGRPLDTFRFIYAGQFSLRKGGPLLIEAWRSAGLQNAELTLIGSWQCAPERRHDMPPDVKFVGPVSSAELRAEFQAAHAFVFPSFFEGFGLVLLEAMACGLPAIATDATAGPDVIDERSGRVIPTGSLEALVESLRWFGANRDRVSEMGAAAREKAERCDWGNYRRAVCEAVEGL